MVLIDVAVWARGNVDWELVDAQFPDKALHRNKQVCRLMSRCATAAVSTYTCVSKRVCACAAL